MQLSIQTTKKDEVIDITREIENVLQQQSVENGIINLFVEHTTCALTVMDLDYGTDLDFLDAIRGMIPKLPYRHPHNPSHVPDHILSSIIGMEVSLPFRDKQLIMGTWQNIVLVELDGPRDRTIYTTIFEGK